MKKYIIAIATLALCASGCTHKELGELGLYPENVKVNFIFPEIPRSYVPVCSLNTAISAYDKDGDLGKVDSHNNLTSTQIAAGDLFTVTTLGMTEHYIGLYNVMACDIAPTVREGLIRENDQQLQSIDISPTADVQKSLGADKLPVYAGDRNYNLRKASGVLSGYYYGTKDILVPGSNKEDDTYTTELDMKHYWPTEISFDNVKIKVKETKKEDTRAVAENVYQNKLFFVISGITRTKNLLNAKKGYPSRYQMSISSGRESGYVYSQPLETYGKDPEADKVILYACLYQRCPQQLGSTSYDNVFLYKAYDITSLVEKDTNIKITFPGDEIDFNWTNATVTSDSEMTAGNVVWNKLN